MLLIGSATYKPLTECQDIDLVLQESGEVSVLQSRFAQCTDPIENDTGTHYAFETDSGLIIEAVYPSDDSYYLYLLAQTPINLLGLDIYIPPRFQLLSLKKAHLIIPHKWERNINSYNELKRMSGVNIYEPVDPLFVSARKYFLQKAKKHPVLKQNKNDFFKDAVTKVFDHDSLHEAISFPLKPAYLGIIDGEVWASKEKWLSLPETERLRCVIEEASVLALERSIIPHLFLNKGYRGEKWAYEFALQKICTTITSGWFRDYCIEVYGFAKANKPNLAKILFEGLKNGIIKKQNN